MNKNWYESKTTWGAVLLAIEAGLITLPGIWIWPEVVLSTLGTFLVLFGFRVAMK